MPRPSSNHSSSNHRPNWRKPPSSKASHTERAKPFHPRLTALDALTILKWAEDNNALIEHNHLGEEATDPVIAISLSTLHTIIDRDKSWGDYWLSRTQDCLDKSFERPLIQAESKHFEGKDTKPGDRNVYIFFSDLEHLAFGALTRQEASILVELKDPRLSREEGKVRVVNEGGKFCNLKNFREKYLEIILGPRWDQRLNASNITHKQIDEGADPLVELDILPLTGIIRNAGYHSLPFPPPAEAAPISREARVR